jgi:hypothetical protein
MKLFLLITGIIIFGWSSVAVSQQKITVAEYIDAYKDLAIKEMKEYHIPASITLAQGILESNSGNSPLAREANNHFGIKCHKEWTGKTFHQDDDEKNECFRKYNKPEESYKDHSLFLTTRERYKLLFELEITDYKGWAHGLKQAGYATNPRYPDLLIKIIEENGLAKYDDPKNQQLASGKHQQVVSNPQPTDDSFNSNLKTTNSKLSSGPPEVFDIVGRGGNDRVVFMNNGVKFILARKGDDFAGIAAEFGIYSWQIYKYNDISRPGKIVSGQKVYLEKKRKKIRV